MVFMPHRPDGAGAGGVHPALHDVRRLRLAQFLPRPDPAAHGGADRRVPDDAFFKAIPDDIEEAARLDGVGWLQIFWHVMLPLARPAMMTLAILTFLYAWNDYLWPLVSAQQREFFTITLGLASIQSNFAQSEGLGRVMASGVIASLPVVILFLIFQRYVVQAMTVGGSKG
jgi:multiple sugar transport system permease protein